MSVCDGVCIVANQLGTYVSSCPLKGQGKTRAQKGQGKTRAQKGQGKTRAQKGQGKTRAQKGQGKTRAQKVVLSNSGNAAFKGAASILIIASWDSDL